jgi:hypothetical protein
MQMIQDTFVNGPCAQTVSLQPPQARQQLQLVCSLQRRKFRTRQDKQDNRLCKVSLLYTFKFQTRHHRQDKTTRQQHDKRKEAQRPPPTNPLSFTPADGICSRSCSQEAMGWTLPRKDRPTVIIFLVLVLVLSWSFRFLSCNCGVLCCLSCLVSWVISCFVLCCLVLLSCLILSCGALCCHCHRRCPLSSHAIHCQFVLPWSCLVLFCLD